MVYVGTSPVGMQSYSPAAETHPLVRESDRSGLDTHRAPADTSPREAES